jgi:hypothetical protein
MLIWVVYVYSFKFSPFQQKSHSKHKVLERTASEIGRFTEYLEKKDSTEGARCADPS